MIKFPSYNTQLGFNVHFALTCNRLLSTHKGQQATYFLILKRYNLLTAVDKMCRLL